MFSISYRRTTRTIKLGNLKIGSGHPIVVQSMVKSPTREKESVIKEIKKLKKYRCEVIRIAVPDRDSVYLLLDYKKVANSVPIVADIHFDYRLAIDSIKLGVDGIRINPGNIPDKEKIKEIIKAAKEREVAIRIGVNAGSLEKRLIKKYGGITPEALAESAEYWSKFFEDNDFLNFKVSIKASDVKTNYLAVKIFAEKTEVPIHIGITESGFGLNGIIKSSIGMALLLSQGIGDTIRVSLTEPSYKEVEVGFLILEALNLRRLYPEIISCPTCGRKKIDVLKFAREVEKTVKREIKSPYKIAVMGCEVNGPGEAKEADFGIAGGKEYSLIFAKGKVVKKVKNEKALDELIKTIKEAENGTSRS